MEPMGPVIPKLVYGVDWVKKITNSTNSLPCKLSVQNISFVYRKKKRKKVTTSLLYLYLRFHSSSMFPGYFWLLQNSSCYPWGVSHFSYLFLACLSLFSSLLLPLHKLCTFCFWCTWTTFGKQMQEVGANIIHSCFGKVTTTICIWSFSV